MFAPRTTWGLQTGLAWFPQGSPGGLMIQALRRLNEPASISHLGIALAVAVAAMSLMFWAVI